MQQQDSEACHSRWSQRVHSLFSHYYEKDDRIAVEMTKETEKRKREEEEERTTPATATTTTTTRLHTLEKERENEEKQKDAELIFIAQCLQNLQQECSTSSSSSSSMSSSSSFPSRDARQVIEKDRERAHLAMLSIGHQASFGVERDIITQRSLQLQEEIKEMIDVVQETKKKEELERMRKFQELEAVSGVSVLKHL